MRVFLDANVLFSASNEPSNLAALIDWAIETNTVVTSDVALHEALRNLERKRPRWLGRFASLRSRLEVVPSIEFELPVDLDANDEPLLCAAIHAHCDLFVTGDRSDFGHLFGRTVMGVRIIEPLALARRLADRRRR